MASRYEIIESGSRMEPQFCHASIVSAIFTVHRHKQGRRSILLTWLFDSQDLVSCVLVPTAIFPLACNANFLVPCFEHHQCHFP